MIKESIIPKRLYKYIEYLFFQHKIVKLRSRSRSGEGKEGQSQGKFS